MLPYLGKKGGIFSDVIKLRILNEIILNYGWILNSMSSILKIEKVEGNLRQTEEDTQAEEGKAMVKTMAETGVMWPKAKKAKEFQQPQKLEEGRERYSPRAFRESTALPRPWFQTSDFRELWESKFLVFQLPSLVLCYSSHGNLIYSHFFLFGHSKHESKLVCVFVGRG